MVVMKPPVFVRTLTSEERQQLQAGLRSKEAFVLKRCHILLASAQGQTVPQIAQSFGYAPNSIRHVLHAFNDEGLAALTRKSNRPQSTPPPKRCSMPRNPSNCATSWSRVGAEPARLWQSWQSWQSAPHRDAALVSPSRPGAGAHRTHKRTLDLR